MRRATIVITATLRSPGRPLAETLLELMLKRCRAVGAALVFVSHDRSLAVAFDRVLELAPHADPVLEAGA